MPGWSKRASVGQLYVTGRATSDCAFSLSVASALDAMRGGSLCWDAFECLLKQYRTRLLCVSVCRVAVVRQPGLLLL